MSLDQTPVAISFPFLGTDDDTLFIDDGSGEVEIPRAFIGNPSRLGPFVRCTVPHWFARQQGWTL